MMSDKKKGQQEIVGFVLIVVLVMVVLMVFLVISVRDTGEDSSDVGVSNMLDIVMRMTTECAIVTEPDYDDFEELFKSCFKGKNCNNLDVSACEYLDETFEDVLDSMVSGDSSVNGWNAEFFEKDGVGISKWSGGNCSRVKGGTQRTILSGGTNLAVRLRIC